MSGDNRDAAYFELSKFFDSAPIEGTLKKGGEDTDWVVKIQFSYEGKKSFHGQNG